MKKVTSAWLRYLANFWTLVSFVAIGVDFFKMNALEAALGPVLAIYIGILVVYSAEKEFERWTEYYEGRHPGEIYVFCWTILISVLILTSLFGLLGESGYKLPSEVISTYIGVISIMAFTRKSKSFFNYRKSRG